MPRIDLYLAADMLGWIAFLRRRENTRTLIWTDPLTGLYNRRAFMMFAEKQMEMLRRKRGALALFYMDLDGFKQINDVHGHRMGDVALKDVAALLKQVFRESDVLCLMGGDEFAILVSDVIKGAEESIKARLQEAVAQDNQCSERGFSLALSIGSILCSGSCLERFIEDLLEHADGLMYGNKRRRKQEALVPLTV